MLVATLGLLLGLAMLLVVVGIAFDRVGFAERYKLMLASTLVSGAVIFPFGVFAADLQLRSDPARDHNHRFGAGDCCAHRNHAWVGRPPNFCGVALTNHSSLSHLEFSKRVEVAGVKAQAQDVTLQVGQIATLKLNLVVGEVSEQVVVEAATEVTEPTRTQISEGITQSQTENLPVNGREFIDFAPLYPGVQIGDTTSGSRDVIVAPAPSFLSRANTSTSISSSWMARMIFHLRLASSAGCPRRNWSRNSASSKLTTPPNTAALRQAPCKASGSLCA